MSEAPAIFQRRIVIGAVFCVAAFALVGMRLVDVTLMRGTGHGGFADHAVTARADLTDRNGELAGARSAGQGPLCPPACLLGQGRRPRTIWPPPPAPTRSRLRAGFDNTKHPYVLVARQITPDTEAKVMHLGLPGLEFEPSAKRYYPDGRVAAQLLGVTDPDNNGVSGLELGLENQIRAAAGGNGRHLHRHAGAVYPGA